jgi:hypothetical protein
MPTCFPNGLSWYPFHLPEPLAAWLLPPVACLRPPFIQLARRYLLRKSCHALETALHGDLNDKP